MSETTTTTTITQDDSEIWDHKAWLETFNDNVSRKETAGIHYSRIACFLDTEKTFERGYYIASDFATKIQLASTQRSLNEAVQSFDFCPQDQYVFPSIKPEQKGRFQSTEKVGVCSCDCVEAAIEMLNNGLKPAILNMANAFHPGGSYRGGAGAQEENLCRRSNLYLYIDPPTQSCSRKKEKKPSDVRTLYPLPVSGGIYCPGVTFIKGNESLGYPNLIQPKNIDVVCVAALSRPRLIWRNNHNSTSTTEPNTSTSSEGVLTDEDTEITLSKIRSIFHIALINGNDSLLLSAFGCGAFGNPPVHMAKLFKQVIYEFWGCFKMIVFAILDDHNSHKKHNPDGNFAPFHRELHELKPPEQQQNISKNEAKEEESSIDFGFIYVHGLVSSGKAHKAEIIREKLKCFGPCFSPDLYRLSSDFENYTITKGFTIVSNAIKESKKKNLILIGSSCGGLLVTRFVQTKQEGFELIRGVVLLAPAIHIEEYIQETTSILHLLSESGWNITDEQFKNESYIKQIVNDWKQKGFIELHSQVWKDSPTVKWSWNFIEDVVLNHSKGICDAINLNGLLIQGDSDNIVPKTVNQNWILNQSSTLWHLVVISDGNHVLNGTSEPIMLDSIFKFVSNIILNHH